MSNDSRPVMLFDGVCNLCNALAQFLIRQDPEARLLLGSLQSEAGRQLLRKAGLAPDSLDTFVLLDGDQVYTQSTAVLEVCRRLGRGWRLLTPLLHIPRPVRDALYRWVARNRYRWFGKRTHCMVPTQALQDRFID